MTLHAAVTALLTLGCAESPRFDVRGLAETAAELALLCDPPAPPPTGAECVRDLVVLWYVETGGTCAMPDGGSGFGPLQVLGLPGWTPPGTAMRYTLVDGLAGGLAIWRAKLRRAGEDRQRAFSYYNGAAGAAGYARLAERLRRRL